MEKIAKGLHGLNKKVPRITLKLDFLSFSLQLSSLFLSMFAAFLWAVFGFDSTIDGAIRTINGEFLIDMGNGVHFSTVLNFFLIVFFISVYLSKNQIIGFHNIIISVFTPISAMMVFEFPWVMLTDIFHNITVEGYWAITLYGLGSIDLGMFIIALSLIPTSVFYFAYHITYEKINLKPRSVLRASYMSWAFVAAFITIVSLWFGTLNVLIRNTFALFFFAFAHASLKDATQNMAIKELWDKYELKTRVLLPLILITASALIFVVWIFWPNFEVIKGTMWPQTVYAYYESGTIVGSEWVRNDAVHFFNITSKFLVTVGVSLLIIPKIIVREKNEKA